MNDPIFEQQFAVHVHTDEDIERHDSIAHTAGPAGIASMELEDGWTSLSATPKLVWPRKSTLKAIPRHHCPHSLAMNALSMHSTLNQDQKANRFFSVPKANMLVQDSPSTRSTVARAFEMLSHVFPLLKINRRTVSYAQSQYSNWLNT